MLRLVSELQVVADLHAHDSHLELGAGEGRSLKERVKGSYGDVRTV